MSLSRNLLAAGLLKPPLRCSTRVCPGIVPAGHEHEAFLYRSNCPNPWNGPWRGYTTHILGLAFLLLNYNEYLSQGQRQIAERFAKDVISFVHGGEPWAAYRNGIQEGSIVYDAPAEGDLDKSEYVGWETPQKTGRRDIMQGIEEPGLLDRLIEGWQLFMAQK